MPVRLFVGNLSYEATEAELRQHFGTIGPVAYCYLPTDRETGRPRGFAFIEFSDDSHAQAAISRLNNQPFRGRPLAVKEAQPRESRPAPGGPRPPYAGGPRPMGRPMPAGPAPPFEPGGGAPRRRDSGNFGPDAPPRGKKGKFKPSEPRGPKGPIRIKPNGRIYSTDDVEEDGVEQFEGDNFATSAPREMQPDDDTGVPRETSVPREVESDDDTDA
jgi:cold-inducible RNA-binding protein